MTPNDKIVGLLYSILLVPSKGRMHLGDGVCEEIEIKRDVKYIFDQPAESWYDFAGASIKIKEIESFIEEYVL